MASYLRPRRGKKSTAETQAIVLKKGEVFFEIGNNGTPTTGASATAFGKIKMGDGTTTYSNLGYFIDVDTSVVDWDNTGYATATSENQGADLYGNLNAIAPTATLKSILGNVKALLYKLSTQVTTLNNECTTSVNGSDLRFSFQYDSATDKLGCLDINGEFVPFSSGGIDTSDATAYARNIESGYTAYCRGEKIIGTATVDHGIAKYYSANLPTIGSARSGLAATSIGDYALFGGGRSVVGSIATVYDSVNCINSSLSTSTATNLSEAREYLGATSNPSYAIFGPGVGGSDVNKMDAYNSSLSKTQLWPSAFRFEYGTAYTGDYALFAGGRTYSGDYLVYDRVDAYNTSLSESSTTALSSGRSPIIGTTLDNYALFGGGETTNIDIYNSSLTKFMRYFSVARTLFAATGIQGYYALFAGGYTKYGYDLVEAFNTSLVRSTPSPLQQGRQLLAATSIGNYALFGGGTYSGNYYNKVDVYDSSLTRSYATELNNSRSELVATSVGNYAIFGGGTMYSSGSGWVSCNTADIYYEY